MPSKSNKPLDLSCTLRQMRDPEIEVECRSCGRSGTFIRADILKKHGASITFAKLRRIAAMGCDRLTGPDGDQCQTRFPCLDETKLPTAKNHILA